MNKHIQSFKIYLEEEKAFSGHTVRNYLSDLQQFYGFLEEKNLGGDIKNIDSFTIRAFLRFLMEKKNNKTSIGRKLATLRAFFKFMCREGFLKKNPALEVTTPKKGKGVPFFLTVDETTCLLNMNSGGGFAGARDLAIIELLYATGMRAGEIVLIDFSDIDFSLNLIRVKGKGKKEGFEARCVSVRVGLRKRRPRCTKRGRLLTGAARIRLRSKERCRRCEPRQ